MRGQRHAPAALYPRERPGTHCNERAVSIKYSECVSVALVIQHAMRVRRITLSSVARSAVNMLPHYLIKGTIFEKKKRY